MQVCIVHESSNKIRFQTGIKRMSVQQADILDYFLQQLRFVSGISVRQRTAGFTVSYTGDPQDRKKLLEALEGFSFYDEEARALVPEQTGRELNNRYEEKLV